MRWMVPLLVGFALAAPAQAQDCLPTLTGQFIQGGLIIGQTVSGTTIRLDGEAVRVADDGLFVFGFGRDQAQEAQLDLACPDGATSALVLDVVARDYDIQRIDNLPAAMVTPDEATLARIHDENQLVWAARANSGMDRWFAEGFIWPAQGIISGVYGSQRILNGQPRQPHYGVDVAAPVGTAVVAPAAGRVTLAESDLYYTGGTVIIDHGMGVSSTLMHMSALHVSLGQSVQQGDLVGEVGATGRVTGPHLDWRMNCNGQRTDPALLVGPMPPQ